MQIRLIKTFSKCTSVTIRLGLFWEGMSCGPIKTISGKPYKSPLALRIIYFAKHSLFIIAILLRKLTTYIVMITVFDHLLYSLNQHQQQCQFAKINISMKGISFCIVFTYPDSQKQNLYQRKFETNHTHELTCNRVIIFIGASY